MCGRYAASRNPADLVEEFEVERNEVAEPLAPSWNVAPTREVYAVLTRRPRGEGGDDSLEEAERAPVRQLRTLRWGLVPSWAKDPAIGSRMINARVETLAEKPAFRRALAARRCLLPADGYYEWYGEKGRKQPFYLHRRDGHSLAMAGLYEFWRDPQTPDGDPGGWLVTCTVITAQASDELGHIHDRMPMVVEPGHWAAWLDPDRGDATTAVGLLVPASASSLEAYAVSTRVNSVRNDGPDLVEPIPLEGAG